MGIDAYARTLYGIELTEAEAVRILGLQDEAVLEGDYEPIGSMIAGTVHDEVAPGVAVAAVEVWEEYRFFLAVNDSILSGGFTRGERGVRHKEAAPSAWFPLIVQAMALHGVGMRSGAIGDDRAPELWCMAWMG